MPMVTAAHAVATALDLVALALALALSTVSFRAYRRTATARYREACLGFLLVTAGLVAETVLLRVGDLPLSTVHAVEALLFALGLGALYLSLR